MLGQMAFSSGCAELSGTRSLRGQACQNHSVHSLPNKVWTVSLFRLINLRFFFCQWPSNTLQPGDLNIPTCVEAERPRQHPLAEDFPNFVGKRTIFIFKNCSGHFFCLFLLIYHIQFVSQGFSKANFLDVEVILGRNEDDTDRCSGGGGGDTVWGLLTPGSPLFCICVPLYR